MSLPNEFSEESIPALLPINRKKYDKITQKVPSNKQIGNTDIVDQSSHKKSEEEKDNLKNQQIFQKKKEPSKQILKKIDGQYDRLPSKLNKNEGEKNKNQLTQENSKSKSLIQQMLKKIRVKNVSQENYPVTNQSIQGTIKQMREQIYQLNQEAENKQSTLRQNPSNHHLKSEINTIIKSIEHCTLIVTLYEEKVQLGRNIVNMQKEIMALKVENKDLKLKIHKGIQTIAGYNHNLPSEKQKKLKQQLINTKQQLEQEIQKKMNLQNEIKSIIMNFKRVFEEAQIARKLVIEKLRNVQERERRLNKMKFEVDPLESPIEVPEKLQKRPTLIETEEKKNYNPEISPVSNQMSYKKGETEKKTAPIPSKQKPENIKSVIPGKPTLEDQIKKMRNNQSAFSKFY